MTGNGTGCVLHRHPAVQLRHKRAGKIGQRHAKFRKAQAHMTKAEIVAANERALAKHAEQRKKDTDAAMLEWAQRWDEIIIFGGKPPRPSPTTQRGENEQP